MVLRRGLQDELFNLTLDQLRVKAERTRAEARLNGSIQRVQLDNQMLVIISQLLPRTRLPNSPFLIANRRCSA